ncbi:MATE family efflux transporter [Clostridia bacterium]
MFTAKDLRKLILPLIVEQFLAVTIGMADTIMVASTGEAAMSSVSLVDAINILLINIFSALATGGAIVASQYLGREDNKRANVAAKQLLLVTTAMSVFIMAVCLIGRNPILDLIFGKIEPEVMDNCRVYFFWSALSYPFLAVYNAGAALYRSMGNSKVSMLTSTLMNAINIAGNALLIFGFHMGVAGAAIASLFARMVGAVLITCLLRFKPHVIQLEAVFKLDFQPEMIKNILKFGVPTGLENGMFQIGRLMTQGLVATFGLTATTANAIGMSLSAFPQIPGTAIGLAMVTVVGQCIGARRQEEAKRYTLKLTGLAYLAMGALNLVMLALLPVVIGIYNPSPATAALARELMLYCIACTILLWPASFVLPNGLRAAGDVRFTMTVSIVSMWVFRIGFSYLLAKGLQMGVLGVWIAMTIDWAFRILCFAIRFFRGKWMNKQLI